MFGGVALAAIPSSLTSLEGTKILWDVPLVEQSTTYSCGAAAVKGVLAYYGHEFQESFLMKKLGTTINGTDHDKMAKLIRQHGISAKVQSGLTLRDLQKSIAANQPVIVENQSWQQAQTKGKAKPYDNVWDFGHYLIVIGLDEKNVYLVDPSTFGKRGFIPVPEFLARWHDLDDKNHKLKQTAILLQGKPNARPLQEMSSTSFGWAKVP